MITLSAIPVALPVGSCCRDQKIERLLSRVTGALGQNIIQLPVGLAVQLIKHKAAYIQAVLGADLCRQHLIKPGVPVIDDALSSRHDLRSLQE